MGVPRVFDLVLRLSGLQGLGEIGPVPIQALVGHFEYPPYVARTALIEKDLGLRRVAIHGGVPMAISLEKAEREKGVQKVEGSAGMELEGLLDLPACRRLLGEGGEKAELNGGQ